MTEKLIAHYRLELASFPFSIHTSSIMSPFFPIGYNECNQEISVLKTACFCFQNYMEIFDVTLIFRELEIMVDIGTGRCEEGESQEKCQEASST